MKFAIFTLLDEPPVPIGMVFWGNGGYKVVWFFTDPERDLQTKSWEYADQLFFKVNDWVEHYKNPAEDEFWLNVKNKLLPEKVFLTQPQETKDLTYLFWLFNMFEKGKK